MSDAFAKQPGPSLHIAGTKGMVEETLKDHPRRQNHALLPLSLPSLSEFPTCLAILLG
jgi:hypothetical protein